jgi:hypothetical protein
MCSSLAIWILEGSSSKLQCVSLKIPVEWAALPVLLLDLVGRESICQASLTLSLLYLLHGSQKGQDKS